MATIKDLASEMSAAFTGKTRDNGETIRILKDGRPQWMVDVICEAHDGGSTLPADHTYEYVEAAVDWIAEGGSEDDFDPEPAIYTHDLLAWLAAGRVDRADAAIEEGGATTIVEACQYGQAEERREVFFSVLSSLRDLAESEDEGDEDEQEETASA